MKSRILLSAILADGFVFAMAPSQSPVAQVVARTPGLFGIVVGAAITALIAR